MYPANPENETSASLFQQPARYIVGIGPVLEFVPLSLAMSSRYAAGFNRIAAQITLACSVLRVIMFLVPEHYHDIDDIEVINWNGVWLGTMVFIG